MLLCTRCAASVSSGWNLPGVNTKGCALTAVQASRLSTPMATYDLRARRPSRVDAWTRGHLVVGRRQLGWGARDCRGHEDWLDTSGSALQCVRRQVGPRQTRRIPAPKGRFCWQAFAWQKISAHCMARLKIGCKALSVSDQVQQREQDAPDVHCPMQTYACMI